MCERTVGNCCNIMSATGIGDLADAEGKMKKGDLQAARMLLNQARKHFHSSGSCPRLHYRLLTLCPAGFHSCVATSLTPAYYTTTLTPAY